MEYHYVYDKINREFFALKLLAIENFDNTLRIKSHYLLKDYRYQIVNGELCISDDAKIQSAMFEIPIVRNKIVPVEREVYGGLHLSPIFYQYADSRKVLSFAYRENMFLVRFSYDDIVFFDGKNISVSRFIVLHPIFMQYHRALNDAFSGLECEYLKIMENHRRLYRLLEDYV